MSPATICGISSFLRLPGEFVVLKKNVFKGNLYVIRIFLKHLLEYWLKPCAKWSQEIFENSNYYLCHPRTTANAITDALWYARVEKGTPLPGYPWRGASFAARAALPRSGRSGPTSIIALG
jgi:hypothetical protein